MTENKVVLVVGGFTLPTDLTDFDYLETEVITLAELRERYGWPGEDNFRYFDEVQLPPPVVSISAGSAPCKSKRLDFVRDRNDWRGQGKRRKRKSV